MRISLVKLVKFSFLFCLICCWFYHSSEKKIIKIRKIRMFVLRLADRDLSVLLTSVGARPAMASVLVSWRRRRLSSQLRRHSASNPWRPPIGRRVSEQSAAQRQSAS